MTYLNWAATAGRRPACVAEAVLAAMTTFGSSGRGTGEADLSAARGTFLARASLSRLLGFSHPERLCFCTNATQALNTALLGLVGRGDHVVATDWDHNSVLRPLARLVRERGARVDFVPAAPVTGAIDYADFERLVVPGTRVVVATHASNLTGNLLDLARVAEIAHAAGALLVVDAAQTAGSVPLDMEAAGVDVLCVTGHKALMGPQGTGAILVAPGVDVAPLVCGGTGVLSFEEDQPAAYPEHLEAGTLNGHGIAGLAAAADFLLDLGVSCVHEHEAALVERFVGGLRAIPGAKAYGCFEGDHAACVALNLAQRDSSSVADELSSRFGIAVRAGAHCAPRMHRALGTAERGAVRVSFGWYTTKDEVDEALEALAVIAGEG